MPMRPAFVSGRPGPGSWPGPKAKVPSTKLLFEYCRTHKCLNLLCLASFPIDSLHIGGDHLSSAPKSHTLNNSFSNMLGLSLSFYDKSRVCRPSILMSVSLHVHVSSGLYMSSVFQRQESSLCVSRLDLGDAHSLFAISQHVRD
jgi:hypothetical protein